MANAAWAYDPTTGQLVPPTAVPGALNSGQPVPQALQWLAGLIGGGSPQTPAAAPVAAPAPPAPAKPFFRPGSPLDRLFNTTPLAPAAPGIPMPTGPIGAPTSGVPMVPTRAMSGGGPLEFSLPGAPAMLPPPMLPPPPQQAVPSVADYSGIKFPTAPGAGDYSRAREAMMGAKPGPIDQESLDKAHVAAVLGGLAGGAGSVDPTSPGSFAAALAKAGAGGSTGAEKSGVRSYEANTRKNERTEDWSAKLAGLEKDITGAQTHAGQFAAELGLRTAGMQKDILTAQQQQQVQAAEIAQRNAENTYKTTVGNQAAQYDFESKKRGEAAPIIKHDANGLTIQQLDPVTRQIGVKYIPTKPVFEQFEKLKPMLDALGTGGKPLADSLALQLTTQAFGSNPLGARAAVQQLAVNDLLEQGHGSTVFGPLYAQASKDATTELNAIPGLQAKPAEYLAELNKRIAARILNQPSVQNSADWIIKAQPHSLFARALAGPAVAPRSNPNAAPTNTIAD